MAVKHEIQLQLRSDLLTEVWHLQPVASTTREQSLSDELDTRGSIGVPVLIGDARNG